MLTQLCIRETWFIVKGSGDSMQITQYSPQHDLIDLKKYRTTFNYFYSRGQRFHKSVKHFYVYLTNDCDNISLYDFILRTV